MVNSFNFILVRARKTTKITRYSIDSSVTMEGEREHSWTKSKCNCGFPQHMLIPKGNPEGFPAQLFVMVSNGNFDQVSISI